MKHLRWLAPFLVLALAACGTAAPNLDTSTPTDSTAEAAPRSEWTGELLRKLDIALRDRVRSGEAERLAIKVHFRRIPDEEELANLMLSRVGDQVVGRVPSDDLRRIAARDDVDRIEQLSDVGY